MIYPYNVKAKNLYLTRGFSPFTLASCWTARLPQA